MIDVGWVCLVTCIIYKVGCMFIILITIGSQHMVSSGLLWSPGVSAGLPWSPVVSAGLAWSPVVSSGLQGSVMVLALALISKSNVCLLRTTPPRSTFCHLCSNRDKQCVYQAPHSRMGKDQGVDRTNSAKRYRFVPMSYTVWE